MILKRNHWLLYIHNFMMGKKVDIENNNFCDLFWSFIMFLVFSPFLILPFLANIAYNKWNVLWLSDIVNKDSDYNKSSSIGILIMRIIASIFIYAVIGAIVYQISIIGLYPTFIVVLKIIGGFSAFCIMIILIIIIATKLNDNEITFFTVMKEGIKSKKEQYCPKIEFID